MLISLSVSLKTMVLKKCSSSNMEDVFLKYKKKWFKKTIWPYLRACLFVFVQMREKFLRTQIHQIPSEANWPVLSSGVAAPSSGEKRHSPIE